MNKPLDLVLYSDYSRRDVHDIFSPNTRFTPSTGTWGMHGIIEIPDYLGDFVFFVTFGQHQASHTFDEWITEEGVISWQSQPKQLLQDRRIQQFIQHNENKNSIYLFLRTHRTTNYTYLGKLRYIAHDTEREKPVYIYWQLIDWPIPKETLTRMQLVLEPVEYYRALIEGTIENKTMTKTNDTISKNDQNQYSSDELIEREELLKLLNQEAHMVLMWRDDNLLEGISHYLPIHLMNSPLPDQIRVFSRSKSLMAYYSPFKLCSYVYLYTNTHDVFAILLKGNKKLVSKRLEYIETSLVGLKREIEYECNSFINANLKFSELSGTWLFHSVQRKEHKTKLERSFEKVNKLFEKGNIDGNKIEFKDDLDRFFYNLLIEKPLIEYDEVFVQRYYTYLFSQFIDLTYPILEALYNESKTLKKIKYNDASSILNESAHQRLDDLIIQIIKYTEGTSVRQPDGEQLCDWIQYCYMFGLYKEGQELFNMVDLSDVNPWYYERTKKLARLCSMRAAVKD